MVVHYKVVSVIFDKLYKSDSARRVLARLGIKPIGGGGRLGDGTLRYHVNEAKEAKRRRIIKIGSRLSIEVGVTSNSTNEISTDPQYICSAVLFNLKSSDSAQRLMKRLGVEALRNGHRRSDNMLKYVLSDANIEHESDIWIGDTFGVIIGVKS